MTRYDYVNKQHSQRSKSHANAIRNGQIFAKIGGRFFRERVLNTGVHWVHQTIISIHFLVTAKETEPDFNPFTLINYAKIAWKHAKIA